MLVVVAKILQMVACRSQQRVDDAPKAWSVPEFKYRSIASTANKGLNELFEICMLLLDFVEITKLNNNGTASSSAGEEKLHP